MTTANSSPSISSVAVPNDDLNTSLKQSPMASKLKDITNFVKDQVSMDSPSIKSVNINNLKSVDILKSDNNTTTNKMSQATNNKLAASMLPAQVNDKQSLALGKDEETVTVTVTTKNTNNNNTKNTNKKQQKQKQKKQQKQQTPQQQQKPQKPQKQKQKKKNKKSKNDNDNNDDLEEMSFLDTDCDLIGMPLWVSKLMENQPTLNIMTIGDVSHGKSTLMWGLCDEKTGRHSSEVKNNMTIKLGYTSCKIFKCINCQNSNNICYFSSKSDIQNKKVQCPRCGQRKPFVFLVRHISFVDCPGHAEFMGTMISAACVADGAVMVIDASRAFPGEQTVQHTSAAHLLGVLTNGSNDNDNENENDNGDSKENELLNMNNTNNGKNRIKVIVAQNKIDLINRQKACQNITEIRYFLGKYSPLLGRDTPIIPISAQSRLNLDALCMCMVKNYPMFSPRLLELDNIYGSPPRSLVPALPGPSLEQQERKVDNDNNDNILSIKQEDKKNDTSLLMNIIRTFDVNRPRELKTLSDIDKLLHGGVLGGVIIDGTIGIGDTISIRPGIIQNREFNRINGENDKPKKRMTKTEQMVEQLLEPKYVYQPIECRVIGLKCGSKKLERAFPGANVGVMLNIDPSLTKHDSRVGHIVCDPNMIDVKKKFPVFNVFVMSAILLHPYENVRFKKLEGIKVNIGSSNMKGFIVKKNVDLPDKKGKGIMIVLENPICAKIASQVTLTRKINGVWRLAAGGVIFTARQCPQVKG